MKKTEAPMSMKHTVRSRTAAPPTFTVAPGGSDEGPGTADQPFATLQAARDAVRKLRTAGDLPREGVIVELAGGTYELTAPFELTAQDSGTEGAPVIYRSRSGERARLVGGRLLTGFAPVTDPDILERLDPAARGKVVATSLRDQGITDLAGISAPEWAQGQPGLELFFKGRRMTIARWPNDDFATVKSVDVEGNTELRNRVTLSGRMRGVNEGRFVYEGDRPERWTKEKEIWLHGHWFWDWADQRQKVASIDTDRHVITMEGPNHTFGYRDGQWYYALNLLCELDQPGEWYLDRDTGVLYFWPPEPITDGDAAVSVTPVLVDMQEASCTVLQGLSLEAVRGTAITMRGGAGNLVCACTISNASSWGVRVEGGRDHGVVGCDVSELGEGGIWLDGGDRVSLTAGNHYAENNHVHHCSRWNPLYQPGISVVGVGNRVAHNLLWELPHTAIGFTGNDQTIEYNEIHSAVYMANDAGAIYTSPPTEELTMYGHVIRHNYVHHLYGFKNRGCNGAVYLDDLFPGTTIYGNVFQDVPRAAFIGGGRDNVIENNIFIDCTPSVHIDARGLGWAAGGEPQLMELLRQYPYDNELWRSRYPTLANIIEDDPMAPKRNTVARNICVRGAWDEIENKARGDVTMENNLVGEDPRFVDEAAGNFALRPDSPAFGLGFKPIPVDRIGLYEDELRASWPIEHRVRKGSRT